MYKRLSHGAGKGLDLYAITTTCVSGPLLRMAYPSSQMYILLGCSSATFRSIYETSKFVLSSDIAFY